MSALVSDAALDRILALQFTVAWAGEGRSEPRRLGWWDTDLVDPAGGGNFFERLLPRTHRWSALAAVREAARRADEAARRRMADADAVRTIFFLGFEVDEQVQDRLAFLKRQGTPPEQALKLPLPLGAEFDRARLEAALAQGEPASFKKEPGGRLLAGPAPTAPDVAVQRLVAALVPLADSYPLPHFAIEKTGKKTQASPVTP